MSSATNFENSRSEDMLSDMFKVPRNQGASVKRAKREQARRFTKNDSFYYRALETGAEVYVFFNRLVSKLYVGLSHFDVEECANNVQYFIQRYIVGENESDDDSDEEYEDQELNHYNEDDDQDEHYTKMDFIRQQLMDIESRMNAMNQINEQNSEMLNQSFDISVNGPPSIITNPAADHMEQVYEMTD